MTKNKKIIIFDFDGTLVDSFYLVIKKFNLLADEFHFKSIAPHEVQQLRYLTSRELITHLNIPVFKIPSIIIKARKYMQQEILNLKPFPDVPLILKKLHEKNIALGILTSNSQDNVMNWLQHYYLSKYFSFIYNESTYFGKKYILKKIINKHKKQPSQFFYIGDETRDIEAANKACIHSIAVTWGFNCEEILLQYHPNHLVRTPEEILKIVE